MDRLLINLLSEERHALDAATVTTIERWVQVKARNKEVWELRENDRSISVVDAQNALPESLLVGRPFAFVRSANPFIFKRTSGHGEDIRENHRHPRNRWQMLMFSMRQMQYLHDALPADDFVKAAMSMHLREPAAAVVHVCFELPGKIGWWATRPKLTFTGRKGGRFHDFVKGILAKGNESGLGEFEVTTIYVKFPHSICPSDEEPKDMRSRQRWKKQQSEDEDTPKHHGTTVEQRKAITTWVDGQTELG